ncbi:MAG TPA: DUF4265 domain-containing protein [Parafilimonas sp.]|nr:DUF4265 domain-containing protein [Parafilimonas sp.]
MPEANNHYTKILFKFYSDILEQQTVETMWATIVDETKGLYKIDSIPFYAPLIASDDIVFAEYDNTEQMLTYRETIQHSGNSVVRVVLIDNTKNINDLRDIFKSFDCVSEKVNEVYFVMEIPANKDYKPIKQKLKELENENIIGYSEPCLSEKHFSS